MNIRFALAAALAALVPLTVFAAGADLKGEPAAGYSFAAAHCSECHSVDSRTTPSNAKAGAPSFQNIADAKTTTAAGLYVFLVSQHTSMPQFMIGEEDRQNVIAYIISLKGRGKT